MRPNCRAVTKRLTTKPLRIIESLAFNLISLLLLLQSLFSSRSRQTSCCSSWIRTRVVRDPIIVKSKGKSVEFITIITPLGICKRGNESVLVCEKSGRFQPKNIQWTKTPFRPLWSRFQFQGIELFILRLHPLIDFINSHGPWFIHSSGRSRPIQNNRPLIITTFQKAANSETETSSCWKSEYLMNIPP